MIRHLKALVIVVLMTAAVAFCSGVWWLAFSLGSHAVAQTPAEMDTMRQVNDRVNRHIRPVVQDDGFATARVLPDFGDCDDYAFSKSVLLKRAGFASDRIALRAVGYRGELHAIVIVDDRWVLDNLDTRIVSVEAARRYYRF